MSGRGQYLYERATEKSLPADQQRRQERLRRQEAQRFRTRLDTLLEQLAQDQASPYAIYLPMLGALMSSMDDGKLLDLRDLLAAIVGD